VHPTAIAGPDKLRLISESLRGEGARVWVPKNKGDTRPPAAIPVGERWYFLEEKYPRYKNLVPRDIASREIFKAVRHDGLGVGGKDQVYLDIVEPDREVSEGRGPDEIAERVEGVVEIYEKFAGADPRRTPMLVFPAVHYSMGGLWVDYSQMTNIEGLFAVGEVDYQYHGANRLGANSLLSCIYGGLVAGPRMVAWAESRGAALPSSTTLERETARLRQEYDRIGKMSGDENPYQLWWELGHLMTSHVTVERHNDELRRVDATIETMIDRWHRCAPLDTAARANQALMFTRQLWNMLVLARVITVGALLRDESRGSHYKPEFPERNDEKFLKTTLARYDAGANHGPKISYEEVDVSLVKPVKRDYGALRVA
jgi:succinate dehydrogenase / fumarate reductase flavoprotein subunit